MIEDFVVTPRSSKDIEGITLAWRDALGVRDEWAPDMISLLENKLPILFPEFALAVHEDAAMGEAEAFTEFSPPRIVVRQSTYDFARKRQGRSRMTMSHELGHLVMHADIRAKPRMILRNQSANVAPFLRAEWQANKFASLFLMPTHILRQFDNVEQIIDCCQVSRQAAQIRFSEAGIRKTTPTCVADLAEQFSKP